uniref:Uncharacterized protein LOC104214174 n=1 Tax=Nicotiana sylvestris TaxID=4096 RepID=A0A1U7VIF5_NICSY|nr:PREDICTED: uncharacterized protein LOC104214174 [Nicotiana sylvestris]
MGSSHNFIDPAVAEHLGCPITQISPQVVVASNGVMKVDKVCRVSWLLLEGAEFAAEFLILPLGSCRVVLGGKRHVLRGAGRQILSHGARKLAKIRGNHSKLCMIQLVPTMCNEVQWYSLEAKEMTKLDPKLLALLDESKTIFDEPSQLPPSRGVFDHRIILQNGTEPINKRPYIYPSIKKDVIETLVKQMLDQEIIQPSSSPFVAHVVLAGKKDETWRLCVDYRDLNKTTVKKKFPIPIVEDLLDELGGSKVFSKIDLWSGYHQLRIATEEIPKTAFRTHSGHYEYLVMPFGLSNDPATFQGLMNSVFNAFLRKYVLGHPIAFISKALSPRHAALSVYDRELLALVHAVTKWSQYLLGQRFIIRAYHKALKYLMEQKLHINSQLIWLTKLVPFDYVIEYKKGVENKVADALSRVSGAELLALLVSATDSDLLQDIVNCWSSNDDLKILIEQLKSNLTTPSKFTWQHDQLRRKGRLVVGKVQNLSTDILKNKTDLAAYPGFLQPLPIPEMVWSQINMDFIDDLPKSKGHEVILVVVYRLSKYAHFMPLKHPYTAQSIAKAFFDVVVRLHGLPEIITSDRDAVFLSFFWQELFSLQGVQLNTSTAYPSVRWPD